MEILFDLLKDCRHFGYCNNCHYPGTKGIYKNTCEIWKMYIKGRSKTEKWQYVVFVNQYILLCKRVITTLSAKEAFLKHGKKINVILPNIGPTEQIRLLNISMLSLISIYQCINVVPQTDRDLPIISCKMRSS